MLAVLQAVLALAGAPADTSFTCSATQVSPWGTATWGWAFLTGRPTIGVYGAYGCAALWYTGASSLERVRLQAVNREVFFTERVGIGLLVDLHEATHVALHSADECLVEKRALALLPVLLHRYFRRWFANVALIAAQGYDASLPAEYHGC